MNSEIGCAVIGCKLARSSASDILAPFFVLSCNDSGRAEVLV
jgi:hypothetical protein